MVFFWSFFVGLVGSFISFLYPMYRSIKAIETDSKDDDTQWLVYWVVIGFVNLIEALFGFVLFVFPFYFEIKLAFVLWLQLPNATHVGSGAQALYIAALKPLLKKYDNDIDKLLRDTFKVVLSNETFKKGIAFIKAKIESFKHKQ
eukprot:c423_g1_i1.p1 GENE.c423_g1_i1~~c423_g1_i1.p1  ORF type:complete len:145 (-),score=10.21 c423_g1_i1:90-524(-)